MRGRRSRAISGLLPALLVAGCSVVSRTPAPPPAGRPPIRIGVITSQSGPLAGYGMQALRGLNLGLAYATGGTLTVAGRPLQVAVRDDEGKPEVGAARAAELLRDGAVDILQGTASSAVAAQIIPLVRQYRKPLLIAPAADDALTGQLFNRYVFRVSPTASQVILAGAAATIRLGRSVGILAPDSAWGEASAVAWQAALGRLAPDISLQPTVYVPLDASDFKPYLQRLEAGKPEVGVLLWSGDNAVQLFAQAAQLGLHRRLQVVAPIGDSDSLRVLQGVEGLVGPVDYYYAFPKNPANDWLVAQHQKRFGRPPDLFTADGFDTGVAIVRALARTGGDAGADRLVAALEGLAWDGAKGPMRFRREDHQALQPLYIARLQAALGTTSPTLLREVPASEATPPVQVPR